MSTTGVLLYVFLQFYYLPCLIKKYFFNQISENIVVALFSTNSNTMNVGNFAWSFLCFPFPSFHEVFWRPQVPAEEWCILRLNFSLDIVQWQRWGPMVSPKFSGVLGTMVDQTTRKSLLNSLSNAQRMFYTRESVFLKYSTKCICVFVRPHVHRLNLLRYRRCCYYAC